MTRTFKALMRQIANPDRPLPVKDLRQLSDMPPSAAILFGELWSGLDLHRRRELMRCLADICRTNFEVDYSPIALLGIQDADNLVRLAAIDTLWDAESSSLIPPLLALMRSDPDMAVQASAAKALGQFVMLGELGHLSTPLFDRLTKELLAAVRDPDVGVLVRSRALEAVAAADLAEVPTLIRQAYHSNDPVLRLGAVSAMGRTADASWERFILGELSSADASMRYQAARAAGSLELRAAIPQLVELLDDLDPEVIAASINALGEIGGEEMRAVLEPLLDDEEFGGLVEEALEMIELSSDMPSVPPFDQA